MVASNHKYHRKIKKTRKLKVRTLSGRVESPNLVLRKRLAWLGFGLVLVLFSFIPDIVNRFREAPKEIQTVAAVDSRSVSFSTEPVKVDDRLKSAGRKKPILPPARILIPTLSIDLSVKEAKVVNGYWEVFADSAGYGIGSGLPGEVNNQVIFAHAREGLFLPLRKIMSGDRIYVLTKSGWFIYAVSHIQEVKPDQVEVIAPSREEILTLYTCSGFADSKRLIVVAKRSP